MLSLGPATEPTATTPVAEEPTTGFDVASDVAALKSKPKQDYSSQWKQPEEPPKTEAPPPTGDAPGATPAEPDPNDKAKAAAREFIECYDMLQAQGFAMYADGIKPKEFELEEYPKERAIYHLAKGLEKMGTPEVPWWIGLLIALAPAAFVNYMTAKESRHAAQEAAARKNQQKHRSGAPLEPNSITDRNGQPVTPPQPQRTGAPPAQAAPAAPKDYGNCLVCNKPLTKPRKKYCGKSCSGKASAAALHQHTAPTQP